jgi:hypothetical protein
MLRRRKFLFLKMIVQKFKLCHPTRKSFRKDEQGQGHYIVHVTWFTSWIPSSRIFVLFMFANFRHLKKIHYLKKEVSNERFADNNLWINVTIWNISFPSELFHIACRPHSVVHTRTAITKATARLTLPRQNTVCLVEYQFSLFYS